MDAYRYRGRSYYFNGNGDKAIADFDHVLNEDAGDILIYNERGLAHHAKGNLDQAIADYSRIIGNDLDLHIANYYPEFEHAVYFNRGRVYTDKQEYDKAIADFTKAIELNGEYTEVLVAIGNVYSAKGEYNKAIDSFNKAVNLDPNLGLDSVNAYYTLGIAYEQLNKKEEAISAFRKYIEYSHDQYWKQEAEARLQKLGAKP